ncbi:MAG: ABC transporter transmembrane domain-containing protein, partial [Bacteroidota bacterium]
MLLYTHVQEDESFSQPRALGPFLKRMLRASYRYKRRFWLLLAGAAGIAIVDGILPLLWMHYIDNWITPLISQTEAGASFWGFLPYAGAFVGTFALQALAIGAFIYCAGQLRERVIFDLREEMFTKLQHLSFSFYDRKSIGHLAIRLTADVRKVTQVISWGLGDVLFGIIMIAVSLTAMFIYNWKLSLIVLTVIPLLLILAIRVRLALLTYARTARRTYSEMAAYLTEHINGMEVNKSTVQEARASENFRDVSGRLEHAAFRSSLYSALYHPIVVGTGSVAAALVIWAGGHLALQAQAGISIGLLAAFFGYARMIFEPIFDITRYYASAQDSLSAGERIFSLIDEEIEI